MGNEHSEICRICTRARVVMGVRNRLRVSCVRPPQRATLSRKCRLLRDSVCPVRRNYDAYASCLKCWIANQGTRRRATKRSGCLLTFVAGNRSWHGTATWSSMKLKDELHVGDIRLTEHRGGLRTFDPRTSNSTRCQGSAECLSAFDHPYLYLEILI